MKAKTSVLYGCCLLTFHRSRRGEKIVLPHGAGLQLFFNLNSNVYFFNQNFDVDMMSYILNILCFFTDCISLSVDIYNSTLCSVWLSPNQTETVHGLWASKRPRHVICFLVVRLVPAIRGFVLQLRLFASVPFFATS